MTARPEIWTDLPEIPPEVLDLWETRHECSAEEQQTRWRLLLEYDLPEGTIVRLKSGGPDMTVWSPAKAGGPMQNGYVPGIQVAVTYFDGNARESVYFPRSLLRALVE